MFCCAVKYTNLDRDGQREREDEQEKDKRFVMIYRYARAITLVVRHWQALWSLLTL